LFIIQGPFSVAPCQTLISEKGLQWQRAMVVFKKMKAARVQPKVITYSAAISVYEKGVQWQRRVAVFEEMKTARVQPTVITYSAV
jgi:pentatricopeptide repeat domain-containing protein 1